MKLDVSGKNLEGSVCAIGSKSDAHRAFIAAALSDKETNITLSKTSIDVDTTINCLEQLGAKIHRNAEGCFNVTPIQRTGGDSKYLNCNESGSTFRFLLPVATALFDEVSFTGEGRLPERPIENLIVQMEAHGCSFSSHKLPFTVKGKLKNGLFEFPGNVSTQYISGILFAAPLLTSSGPTIIKMSSPLQSQGYVDMTIDTLNTFGVQVIKYEGEFKVSTKRYVSPGRYVVEGDWSNAAFFLVADVLGANIEIAGLNIFSSQSDRSILDVFKASNITYELTYKDEESILQVTPTARFTLPEKIDISKCPDLLPVLSVLASFSSDKTRFIHAEKLRFKESDRLLSTQRMINNLGGKAEIQDNSFTVYPVPLKGGEISSFGDHRIAMAAATASVKTEFPVVIDGAECVSKSYPHFFDELRRLGGQIDKLH